MADKEKITAGIEEEEFDDSEETAVEGSDNSDKPDKKDAKGDKGDKAVKPKKPKAGITEKISRFWRDYKSELKKIVWFSRKDTLKSTALCLVIIVTSGALVALLDLIFSKGLISWLGGLI
ncbi:MAG: preprotein translocase subunit SecE [Clostridiales bacterium]|nr:preprotein translocase subunit SecE [Clostridiales bacterium]